MLFKLLKAKKTYIYYYQNVIKTTSLKYVIIIVILY